MKNQDKKVNKQANKRFDIGEHFTIRLSEKSGTTQELLDMLNYLHDNKYNLSTEVIKSLKLRMDLEKNYTKTQIEKLRNGYELKQEVEVVVKEIEKESYQEIRKDKKRHILNKNDYINSNNQVIESNSFEESIFGDELKPESIEEDTHIIEFKSRTKDVTPAAKSFGSLASLRKAKK